MVFLAIFGAAGCTRVVEAPPLPPKAEAAEPPRPERVARPSPVRRQTPQWLDEGAEAPASAPRDAGGGAPDVGGSARRGPSKEAIGAALERAMPDLAACLETSAGSGPIRLQFEADPAGRASKVKVTGVPRETEHCVRTQVAAVRFPTFDGAPVAVEFPIAVYRAPAAAAAPAAPTPAPVAGPPPLFVKP